MYVYRPTTENKPEPKPSPRNNARAAVFERDNAARLRLDPERVDELLAAGCIEIDPAEFPILARHWQALELRLTPKDCFSGGSMNYLPTTTSWPRSSVSCHLPSCLTSNSGG